jgi:hypothetical protein
MRIKKVTSTGQVYLKISSSSLSGELAGQLREEWLSVRLSSQQRKELPLAFNITEKNLKESSVTLKLLFEDPSQISQKEVEVLLNNIFALVYGYTGH